MFSSNNTPFTMPVTPANNGGFGFGGNGFDSIIALAILAMIFGWGNGGYGGYGGGVSENYTLISDMGQLERKIDGVYSGICDSTFALNNTITNGFASAQNTMTQGFAGLNTALVTQGYESRIATQGVGNTVQNCCCDLKQQIGDVNYNMATQANMLDRSIANGFCQTNFNNQTNTRDIIDATNAGFQKLDAKIDSIVNSQKDAKIAEQACVINNQYLLSQINKTAVPAYIVQNPNCCCQQNLYGTQIG